MARSGRAGRSVEPLRKLLSGREVLLAGLDWPVCDLPALAGRSAETLRVLVAGLAIVWVLLLWHAFSTLFAAHAARALGSRRA